MARSARGTSSAVTTLLAISVAVCTTIAVLGTAAVTSHVISLRAEANAAGDSATAQVVNRERKSDALPFSQAAQERLEIKSVEVVGLRDAAIVYRDREGNILFKTDPLANVTVVTKNVDLPAVTIRETADTKVERVDAEKKPAAKNPLEAAPSMPPLPGCESAFARPSPEALTNKTGRCLASL
jgi:hypothetical protein